MVIITLTDAYGTGADAFKAAMIAAVVIVGLMFLVIISLTVCFFMHRKVRTTG